MLTAFWADPAFHRDGEQYQSLRKRQILITAELISPVIRLTLTASDEIRHMLLEGTEDVALAVREPSTSRGLVPVFQNICPCCQLFCFLENIGSGAELIQLSAHQQQQLFLALAAPGDQVAEPVVECCRPLLSAFGPRLLQSAPVANQGRRIKARLGEIEPQGSGLLECGFPPIGQIR